MAKLIVPVSRTALLDSLNIAKPAVGRGLFVPVLAHFSFTGDEVIAYDDAIAISITHDLPVKCAVPANLVLRLLNSLSSDDMDLDIEGGHLKIKCGKSNLKVPALGEDAFIFKKEFGPRRAKFNVVDQFIEGIDACLISVGIDPTHPAQLGVTLISEGDGKPALFSTDNVTMSRFDLKDKEEEKNDKGEVIQKAETLFKEFPELQVLLPTEFCRQLSSLRSKLDKDKNEVAIIHLYESCVVARFGTWGLLYAKLINNDKSLDFATVFNRMVPDTGRFCVLPPSWDSTFERACAVADPTHPTTEMSGDGKGEVLVVTKSQFGESVDQIEAAGIHNTTKPFLIDPRHVVRATRLCSKFAFFPKALVLKKDDFYHLISHCVV